MIYTGVWGGGAVCGVRTPILKKYTCHNLFATFIILQNAVINVLAIILNWINNIILPKHNNFYNCSIKILNLLLI